MDNESFLDSCNGPVSILAQADLFLKSRCRLLHSTRRKENFIACYTAAAKNRFLNMNPKQVRKRYKRMKQKEYRKALLQNKLHRPASKADAQKARPRKARPCCGLQTQNCMCKPPPGMKKSYLSALSRRFASTALASVQDTTDVSTFQTLMAERCKTLPLGVLLAYAHTHVVFNQSHLLHNFIEQKAFLFKPPWFDWQKLQSIVNKAKEAGERTRSSNYRSTTLK